MPTDYARIARAIRLINDQPGNLTDLAGLADHLELGLNGLQHLCQRWAEVEPDRLLPMLKGGLEQGRAWLASSSGALDASDSALTLKPGTVPDVCEFGFQEGPFGLGLLAIAEGRVCHLVFLDDGDDREAALENLRHRWPGAELRANPEATGPLFDRIFAPRGDRQAKPVPLLPIGTPFQFQVWNALLRIPPGQVTSYDALARQIGTPGAARAVGGAVGANMIGYLIPCHRVIRNDGALSQYRWGTDRKRAMLAWEAARLEGDPAKTVT